jgi:hypothetical protein
LPLIEETLARLAKAKVYSKIDIRQAFHRIRMDPDSEDFTTFITRHGSYKYKVLPFGLTGGPSTFQHYINDVLSGPVREWIDCGEDFVLEEDKDSGHGTGARGPVQSYKQQIGLKCFFNAPGSPDLAPIENIWRCEKQGIKSIDHFDDETLVEAIKRAWKDIKQETIDRYVDSMIDRMKSLAKCDGDVTEF